MASQKDIKELTNFLVLRLKKLPEDYLRSVAGGLLEALEKVEKRGGRLRNNGKLLVNVTVPEDLPWVVQEMKRLRLAAGKTQRDAAARLGKSLSAIMRKEAGVVKFSWTEAVALAEFYGVTDQAELDKIRAAALRLRRPKR